MADEAGVPERRVADRRAGPQAGYVHRLGVYQGKCGHLWDRRVEDTDECARCGLEAIFNLQWRRWHEVVIPAWQAAHPGMELTWPDLGEALRWLLEGRDEGVRLKAALASITRPLGCRCVACVRLDQVRWELQAMADDADVEAMIAADPDQYPHIAGVPYDWKEGDRG